MTVLSAYSVQELQAEIDRRAQDMLKERIQAVYEAVQEAENVAVKLGINFELNLGADIQVTFDVEEEDWNLT